MTRLITVTQADNNESVLVNIDSIKMVTLDKYVDNANSNIEFNNDSNLYIVETLEQIQQMCNV